MSGFDALLVAQYSYGEVNLDAKTAEPFARRRTSGESPEQPDWGSIITIQADVVVIGFGPVGAAVAGLLGRRGLRVTVIERATDVFPLPRAAHVDHTGLRTWQEIGVLDQLLPGMEHNRGLDFVTADGELLVRVPSDQGSISGLPTSMYFFQPVLDRTVRATVESISTVTVALGVEVLDVEQRSDRVIVRTTGQDGIEGDFVASWVVACDGPSSTVRQILGITSEDLAFEEPWLVVDLVLAEGTPRDLDRAICWCDPARPTYSIPMPFGRHRFEFRLMPGDDPADIVRPEAIQELIARWFPDGIASIERSAIYTFHGLVANGWRQGRILLAGDAVHQMPPFLGQGMCSGLRDAANLAWKLDSILRGSAPEALLDTYEAERRPHARAVVESAVLFGRVICVTDPQEAARRDREMLAAGRSASQRLAFTLPDLAPGPLVLEGGGELFIQTVGSGRLDDVIGSRFAVLTTRPEVLMTVAGQRWQDAGAFLADVGDLEKPHDDAVREWLGARQSETVIVRPDRYVLWSGSSDFETVTKSVGELIWGRAPSP